MRLELTNRQTVWPASSWDPPVSTVLKLGLQMRVLTPGFDVGAGDQNPDAHLYPLLTESSPWPLCFSLCRICSLIISCM